MFIQKLLSMILVLLVSLVVQASPIKRISNYDRLVNGLHNFSVKVIGVQQKFVARGKTTLHKIGRGTAVGSLNILAVACLTSFALDGCRTTDDQQVIGAISNYSQGRAHDQRFSQLHEDNYLTYRVVDDGKIEIVVVDETTSTVDTVKVRPLSNYWTVLDWLEPEISSTWDNRLIENGALLARLIWHRTQTVSWDQLGEPLVADGLKTILELALTPDDLISTHETVEAIDGKRYPIDELNTLHGHAIAVFGDKLSTNKYLVRINRISTDEGQLTVKNIYGIASYHNSTTD